MPATHPSRPSFAIAGAGIAGLTAALALARRGFQVTVFEQAAELREIGAGIQLSPNAMHVLNRLGLDDEIIQRAIEPLSIDIRLASTGRRLASIALKDECRTRYGAPYIVIHRADLVDVLLAAAQRDDNIALNFGSPVEAVRPEPGRAEFSCDGQQLNSDLLLAADGVHSSIRVAMTGLGATDLSQTAWRATVRNPDCYDVMPADRTGLWLGEGVHLVHYALRGSAELNLVLISHSASGNPGELLEKFSGPVRERLSDVDWLAWPLMRVDNIGDWYCGRVVFLGDAAHAMLPTSAQGGAQAIEDAFVLGTCLDKSIADPGAALKDWQRRRRTRVLRIAAQATDNLRIYGLGGVAASARNAAIRALPGRVHLARLDWLYGWRPD